eukprot:4474753-Pleurochrysis_carterae.AAC.3
MSKLLEAKYAYNEAAGHGLQATRGCLCMGSLRPLKAAILRTEKSRANSHPLRQNGFKEKHGTGLSQVESRMQLH